MLVRRTDNAPDATELDELVGTTDVDEALLVVCGTQSTGAVSMMLNSCANDEFNLLIALSKTPIISSMTNLSRGKHLSFLRPILIRDNESKGKSCSSRESRSYIYLGGQARGRDRLEEVRGMNIIGNDAVGSYRV